jgi:S-DNA-T family DNA segregation ATPase FtsK/SpoIIIE
MSKHKKPGRPKGSKNKSGQKGGALSYFKPTFSTKIIREISGLVLFAFSVIIFLGLFGWAGNLGATATDIIRGAIGWAAYILPVILIAFSIGLFFPEKLSLNGWTYLGLIGLVSSFAGMFQIFVPLAEAEEVAGASRGGGSIGLLIQKLILQFFNAPVSFIVLFVLAIVFFIITTNASLRDLIASFRKKETEDEVQAKKQGNIQIHQPGGITSKPNISIPSIKPVAKKEDEYQTMRVGDDSGWITPPLSLLENSTTRPDAGNIQGNISTIQKTLSNFDINVSMGDVNVGPTVTQYTLKPEDGVKLNKITTLDRDLALSLAAHPIRIEAPIPGKSLVGVEIPNKSAATVRLRTILETETWSKRRSNLSVVLGLDVAGHPQIADLTKMPHLLIAGSTGSGKSVCINTIILSLLYQNSPKELKMILVDPKRVELSSYNNMPHLLTPVIVEPDKTVSALKWAIGEMEHRYRTLQAAGKRNIAEYNSAKGKEGMPYIVIVIDELAQLMAVSAKEVEGYIVQLAQLARAVGIHLILATQRPSVDVITGLIKANVTTRVAFAVASQVDSRTILDQSGAEKLLGMGDMLFVSADSPKPKRIQGAFISEKEINGVSAFIKDQGEPEYNEEILKQATRASSDLGAPDDDLFLDAADCSIRAGKASASLLQRRLRIGYARAARLLDLLEERGIIGPADGARPRDVLVSDISEVISEEDQEDEDI